MDGTKLREARAELGWSREKFVSRANQIAAEQGITPIKLSGLAAVEQGKREARPNEAELFRLTLVAALGRVITEEVPVVTDALPATGSAASITTGGRTRSYEWDGLKRGDSVRVAGERGTFTFLYHHADDHQEYVEVSGPRMVVRGRAIGWKQRSVTPDRVRRKK